MHRLSRVWPFALFLFGAMSCGGDNDSGTVSDGQSGIEQVRATTEPYEAPVLAATSAALGADLADIYRAVLLARRSFVADCVGTSGFTVSSNELDDMFIVESPDGGNYGCPDRSGHCSP